MARNSEKAQSMLFRFLAHTASEAGIIDAGRTRRPKLITEVSSMPICEKWRSQVLKEISRKVLKIQDEALSDAQLRDLNDEINKLMREKWMWERRIGELGGGDYRRMAGGPKGHRGYQYFGRARGLPGVKEMFEEQDRKGAKAEEKGKGRVEGRRREVDAAYYGYLDEDDEEEGQEGGLVGYEVKREREVMESMAREGEGMVPEGWEELPGDVGDGVGWRVPTAEEVQEELVERRRRRLLDTLG